MAELRRVAVLVPNLFLRVPIDSAIRGAGADPESVSTLADALASHAGVVIADLDVLGVDATGAVRKLVAAGKTVIAFGPHVDAERLRAVRTAGGVALPRSAFLAKLPELLTAALRPARG